MIITCEKCSSRFMTSAAALEPEGRTVRCANCGHSWFQSPRATPPPEPKPVVQQAPKTPVIDPADLDAVRARARQHMKQRMTPAKAASWAAFLLILGVGLFGINAYANQIVRVWPQSAKAYSLFGRDVNIRGFEIEEVNYTALVREGAGFLEVTGQVRNLTDAPMTPPLLRASLRDSAGSEVGAWTFAASDRPLEPGSQTRFVGRGPAPLDIAALEVRFIRSEDIDAIGLTP